MKTRLDETNHMRKLMGLKLIKEQEEEIYYSKCSGEVWGSDVCTEGTDYSNTIISLANHISDSCNCFKDNTNWDEEEVKKYLLQVPEQDKMNFNELLYCYMSSNLDLSSNNAVEELINKITPSYQKSAADYTGGLIGDDTDWSQVKKKFNIK